MKKIIKSSLAYSLVILSFISCSKKSNNQTDRYSEVLGFDLSAPENGGLPKLAPDSKQIIPDNMVFIEGGTFTVGQIQENVMGGVINKPQNVHIKSFYMDETEITNREYTIYLDWLKKVYPPENPKYKHIYAAALPNENVWKTALGSNGEMSKVYLRSRAYEKYPVVGISWRQAKDYCKWRTDRTAERTLIEEGILKPYGERGSISEEGQVRFDAEVFELDPKLLLNDKYSIYTEYVTTGDEEEAVDSLSTGSIEGKSTDSILNIPLRSPQFSFRLPTEVEWEYAAKAEVENRSYNTIRGRKKYAWSGEISINQDPKSSNYSNFKQSKGDYSGIAGWTSDGQDYTAAVGRYKANAFGLYDMTGNVSEWVADNFRHELDTQENDLNYFRGNVFTKNKIDKDGKIVIVDLNNMVYDTLPNGKIVPAALPGQIAKEELTKNDLYFNSGIQKSDNKDFKDGDLASLRDYQLENEEERHKMYNSPIIPAPKFNEKTGEYDLVYDDKPRTTLITKYSRVYKGGSWKDREFWLDPTQRRFLEEYMSTNYIGFRCVMSHIGPSHDGKKRRTYH